MRKGAPKASVVAVALLRGINLGRTHKVPMAELRSVLGSLGLRDVQTWIQSGNAVFRCTRAELSGLGERIEQALQARFGFPIPIVIRTDEQLAAIVASNPYTAEAEQNGSRLLVAFAKGDAGASYAWCPDGVLAAKLPDDARQTSRNWNTVVRLAAMAQQLRSLPEP